MKTKFSLVCRRARWLGLALCAGLIPLPGQTTGLQWESQSLQLQAKPDETSVAFAFRFSNPSADEVVILEVAPSCGCTTLNLPSLPWTVKPGAAGVIEGRIDTQGKHGVLSKTITLQTSQGTETLSCRITVPEVLGEKREQNIRLARADRQAVFKGDCASCHAAPAKGLADQPLYTAACAICHEGEHRASLVPDLFALTAAPPKTPAEWEVLIRAGKEGTLMPAFAQAAGDPLDDAQIQSLVRYLVARRATIMPSDDN